MGNRGVFYPVDKIIMSDSGVYGMGISMSAYRVLW